MFTAFHPVHNTEMVYHPSLLPDEVLASHPADSNELPGIYYAPKRDYWLMANDDPNFDWATACHPGCDYSKDGIRQTVPMANLPPEGVKLIMSAKVAHEEALQAHTDVLNKSHTCVRSFINFNRLEEDEPLSMVDVLPLYHLSQILGEIALPDIIRRLVREKEIQMTYCYLMCLEFCLSNSAAIRWFLKRECAPIPNKRRTFRSKDCFIMPMVDASIKCIAMYTAYPDDAWVMGLKVPMRCLIIFRKLVPFTKYSRPLIDFLQSYSALTDMLEMIEKFVKKHPERRTNNSTIQLQMIKRLIYMLKETIHKVTTKNFEYGPQDMDEVVRLTNIGGIYVVFCSSPECHEFSATNKRLRHCGRCQLSRYCSKDCQKYHWKNGHREKCLKLNAKSEVRLE